MPQEVAKLLLEHAATLVGRAEAIEAALRPGMRLAEIEGYLDWLDSVQCVQRGPDEKCSGPPPYSDKLVAPAAWQILLVMQGTFASPSAWCTSEASSRAVT
jgi:hypothetical protein